MSDPGCYVWHIWLMTRSKRRGSTALIEMQPERRTLRRPDRCRYLTPRIKLRPRLATQLLSQFYHHVPGAARCVQKMDAIMITHTKYNSRNNIARRLYRVGSSHHTKIVQRTVANHGIKLRRKISNAKMIYSDPDKFATKNNPGANKSNILATSGPTPRRSRREGVGRDW